MAESQCSRRGLLTATVTLGLVVCAWFVPPRAQAGSAKTRGQHLLVTCNKGAAPTNKSAAPTNIWAPRAAAGAAVLRSALRRARKQGTPITWVIATGGGYAWSGRALKRFGYALTGKGIGPHYVVGDMGHTVTHIEGGKLCEMKTWHRVLSRGWDDDLVTGGVQMSADKLNNDAITVKGFGDATLPTDPEELQEMLSFMEAEHSAPDPFKRGFAIDSSKLRLDPERHPEDAYNAVRELYSTEIVRALRNEGVIDGKTCRLVLSGSATPGKWYVDVLAKNGGKANAIRWLQRILRIPDRRVLVVAETGADIGLLAPGNRCESDLMGGRNLAAFANMTPELRSALETKGYRDVYFVENPHGTGIADALTHFGWVRPP